MQYTDSHRNFAFKESKKHLGQLASLGALGPLVEDIASENQHEYEPDGSNQEGNIVFLLFYF